MTAILKLQGVELAVLRNCGEAAGRAEHRSHSACRLGFGGAHRTAQAWLRRHWCRERRRQSAGRFRRAVALFFLTGGSARCPAPAQAPPVRTAAPWSARPAQEGGRGRACMSASAPAGLHACACMCARVRAHRVQARECMCMRACVRACARASLSPVCLPAWPPSRRRRWPRPRQPSQRDRSRCGAACSARGKTVGVKGGNSRCDGQNGHYGGRVGSFTLRCSVQGRARGEAEREGARGRWPSLELSRRPAMRARCPCCRPCWRNHMRRHCCCALPTAQAMPSSSGAAGPGGTCVAHCAHARAYLTHATTSAPASFSFSASDT